MSRGPWGFVAARLAALVVAALLLGYFLGRPFAWLSAFLLVYLGWHL